MAETLPQYIEQDNEGNRFIKYDWFPMAIPGNVYLDEMAYPDTMYSFSNFHSQEPCGFSMGFASGNYTHSHFSTGKKGNIQIGKFVILVSTNIVSCYEVRIGDHCMFSWGSYITDSWLDKDTSSTDIRKKMLEQAALSPDRFIEFPFPKPVIIEENVWVGFGAVILPGVRLGRGCIIGCKTVIDSDVPPYAIVVGQPAKIIKYLDPDDNEQSRKSAFEKYLKIKPGKVGQ